MARPHRILDIKIKDLRSALCTHAHEIRNARLIAKRSPPVIISPPVIVGEERSSNNAPVAAQPHHLFPVLTKGEFTSDCIR